MTTDKKVKLETICLREGCENPIPKGRRKYCSDKCSRYVNRKTTKSRYEYQKENGFFIYTHSDRYVRKQYAERPCIVCGELTPSDFSHRKCKRCQERDSVPIGNLPVVRSEGRITKKEISHYESMQY